MLNRLLIVLQVEQAMWNIGVNLCLLVLRSWGSMVLQGSRIMNAPGILWSTPPVHISSGILKGSIFCVEPSIPALRGTEVVWWFFLHRKPHSWALSLMASSVVSSLSLLCLVSLSLWAILWHSELLFSSICSSILIRMGRCSFGCVSSISKEGCGY